MLKNIHIKQELKDKITAQNNVSCGNGEKGD